MVRIRAQLDHWHVRCLQGLHIDPLTRLHNRRAFDQHLARARGATGVLAWINLDAFKLYNVVLGVQEADGVLRLVAQHLKAALPRAAKCFRVGGDEFAVLWGGVSVDEAVSALKRWREALLADPSFVARAGMPVQASVGVLALQAAPSEPVEAAERAMLEAKLTLKGVVAHHPDLPHGLPPPTAYLAWRQRRDAHLRTDPVTGLGNGADLTLRCAWIDELDDDPPYAKVRVAVGGSGDDAQRRARLQAVAQACTAEAAAQGQAYAASEGVFVLVLQPCTGAQAEGVAERLSACLARLRAEPASALQGAAWSVAVLARSRPTGA